MDFTVDTQGELEAFGYQLGRMLRGGEVIELIGDVGAGKTTLTKSIGRGLNVQDDLQSPSFTISRVYEARDGLHLCHYDFYRLREPGVMAIELAETLNDRAAVTIVEWGEIVESVLPDDRLTIRLLPFSDTGRKVRVESHGELSKRLTELLR